MELRHLRYFVAVAEELHFRRAAERLYVAQPAVSEQVRKLEEELGVRLFDRTQRSVSLTDAGAALLGEARRVLRQAELAQLAARNARDRTVEQLRIGFLPDSLPGGVPLALQRLAGSTPPVEVQLETGPALRLIEEVRAERLDAAVVCLPAPVSGLSTVRLGQQQAVAVLPIGHSQAARPAIDLERLAPERIVVLARETNPAFHDAVVASCHEAGLAPTFVEVAEPRVEHALLAVAAGAGMALLPESVADHYATPGICFLPLEGAAPVVETAVVTREQTQHAATLTFLHALSRAGKLKVLPAAPAAVPLAA
jgi:DNA-binding transcriptional LysR family regulator